MVFSSFPKFLSTLSIALSLFLHAARGEIICENLPKNMCAFSISSSGKRCLLENFLSRSGATEYQCRTSEVVVEKMAEYIETDECIEACGADRNAVGISSDVLMEPQFTAKLCSSSCYQNCPNIVDLYFNMAAGEGVFLPDLCKLKTTNPKRAMAELKSSGAAFGPTPSDPAQGPASSESPSSSVLQPALSPASPSSI